MDLSPAFLLEFANRIGAAAQNVMEVARFGGLETDEVPSPFEVTYEHRTYRQKIKTKQKNKKKNKRV